MTFDDREPVGATVADDGLEGASDRFTPDPSPFLSRPDVDVAHLIRTANQLQDDLSGVPLPDGDLPGFGERTDTCGDDFPNFCDGCGDPVVLGRTCRRSVCPRCAPAWARSTAARVGAKLSGLGAYETVVQGQDMYYHHLVLSPPDDFLVDADDPDEARREARDAIKELSTTFGLRGGYWFYHPYRTDDAGDGADDRGAWKELLFENQDWEDVREQLRFEPHFHVLGVGAFLAGGDATTEFHDNTGWVYKRITEGGDDSDSNVSIFGDYELAKALTYTLSHVEIYEQGDQMRGAFGRFGEHIDNVTTDDRPELREEWERLTRAVAPETLGLPYQTMVCDNDLEAVDDDHEHDGDDDDRGGHGGRTNDSAGEVRGLSSDDPRLSSSTSEFRSSRGGMPTPRAGDLPLAPSRTDLPWSAGGAFDLEVLPRQRLEALQAMTSDELVASFEELTAENVYEFMDALDDVDVAGDDVCGGNFRPLHHAPRYLVDADWRDGAAFVDELIDTVREQREAWADDPPHTYAKLLLRNLRDHADHLPDELLDPGG